MVNEIQNWEIPLGKRFNYLHKTVPLVTEKWPQKAEFLELSDWGNRTSFLDVPFVNFHVNNPKSCVPFTFVNYLSIL